MKKIYKVLLYLRIKWNWQFTLHYRRRVKPLLNEGIPNVDSLEYARILRLDQKNAKHCGRVTALAREFPSI